jgi:CRISPR-associated exonuclease Cas4
LESRKGTNTTKPREQSHTSDTLGHQEVRPTDDTLPVNCDMTTKKTFFQQGIESSSDVDEEFCNVTDIKQFMYCPRVVYFERVMHARPIMGSQQAQSKEEHVHLEEKERKRKTAVWISNEFESAEKSYRLPLASEKLRLRGVLDLLLILQGELLPVEYKNTRSDKGRIRTHHKYQLTGYALLLEEAFGKTVLRGVANYVPEKLALIVDITPAMKRFTIRIISEVSRISREQFLPPVSVPPSKCHGCGYFWVCQHK